VHGTGIAAAIARPPSPPGGDVGDTSGLIGTWFVNRGAARFTLTIHLQAGHLVGTLSPDGTADASRPIEHVTWDADQGQLRFRVEEDGKSSFYAVDVVEGTMAGRFAVDVGGRSGPTDWSTNSGHLMGWRRETFDADLVPRVYDLVIDDGRFVRLRLDRNQSDPLAFVGELKLKATTTKGSDGELPAQPILVRRWDGTNLVFELVNGSERDRFTASVNGRNLDGVMVENRTGIPIKFSGSRTNVLSFGLRTKTGEARREWQERMRHTLYRLMMGGNPAPLSTAVTVTDRPLLQDQIGADRDDNGAHWLRQYRLTDVVLDQTIPNPYGTEPLTRRLHGILAVPTTPPPAAGYSIVLAVNGHGGSAEQHFQSDGYHWYGDAFARRGYVVLALDISHRPLQDNGGLYGWPIDGDSPETGNHAHPAIAAPGLDSDWSEDGERVWDSMRGIDFLLAQPSVNPNQIIVTGISMGAEVSELVGALDPRVTTVVPAGAPPDLSLMTLHGNHTCWQWVHADATEFVEVSDYLAMTAPRNVLMESGKADFTFSSYALPYAVEKETAWRARIAYGADASKFVHYLHSGAHQYRVGDSRDDSPNPDYIQVPQLTAPPSIRRWSNEWQVSGDTVSLDQTLFDYLARQAASSVNPR
jgi:dienelactone hydrolase